MSWSKRIYLDRPLRKVTVGYSGKTPIHPAEVVRREQEAYAKGRQDATDELNQHILHNRREVHQLVGQTLEVLDARIENCLKDLVQGIPGLVMDICRQVLGGMELDGAVVRSVVDDILRDLPAGGSGVVVYLCPKNLELFRSYVPDLNSDYPNVRFEEDVRLISGDCRVESRFGEIDGRVGTKLKHLEDQLSS